MSLADDFLKDVGDEAPQPPRVVQAPEPLSAMDKLLAKVPSRLVNNPAVAGARNIVTQAAAPVMGIAQLFANAMPDSTGVPQLYNQKIAEVMRKDAQASSENPFTAGTNKIVGAAISPVNATFARLPAAVTATQRAIQGGLVGGAAGLTSPTEVGESGKFWGPKAAQTVIGTGAGAVLGPIVGYVGDKILSRINAKDFNPGAAGQEADNIISGALKESNQKLEDIPPEQLQQLRTQTVEALSQGKRLDAAAALRMKDFAAEGIQGTQGQITRDPMQFADEQTMKGISRPLSMTLEAGNKKVMQGIGQYGANAQEGPVASSQLADALRKYDAGKAGEVSAAYGAARESAGNDLLAPTDRLITDYKKIASDFEDKLPKAVQSKFDRLGFQFTPEEADNLRKAINDHVGSDPVTNKALGRLRESLNTAQRGFDAQGGPFAPAVKMASERFAEHEQIPALNAAVTGDAGDNFVSKYVINGQTADVKQLAALLRKQSPDTFQEVRQQIGADLARKAFGENVAADKPIAQESYNKALRTLGSGKLEAFFEPHEVEQLKRLGRIGAYQQSNPAAAATNFSNSAGALANLLRSGGGIPVFGKTLQFGGEKLGGYAAIHPAVPVTPNLTPEQRVMMSRALLGITGAAGMTAPRGVVGQ